MRTLNLLAERISLYEENHGLHVEQVKMEDNTAGGVKKPLTLPSPVVRGPFFM